MSTNMRTLLIVVTTWSAATVFATLFAFVIAGDQATRHTILAVSASSWLAFAVYFVWSRIDQALPRRWQLVFEEHSWHTETWYATPESPRAKIAQIEGGPLHRRLGLAARALPPGNGWYGHSGWLDLTDAGEPFQAAFRLLPSKKLGQPKRWLIRVHHPELPVDKRLAPTVGAPESGAPRMLAAVVALCEGTAMRFGFVEELYAFNAADVAAVVKLAWDRAASHRGLGLVGSSAGVCWDGRRWAVDLTVRTTPENARPAVARLYELVGEHRVPIAVTVHYQPTD